MTRSQCFFFQHIRFVPIGCINLQVFWSPIGFLRVCLGPFELCFLKPHTPTQVLKLLQNRETSERAAKKKQFIFGESSQTMYVCMYVEVLGVQCMYAWMHGSEHKATELKHTTDTAPVTQALLPRACRSPNGEGTDDTPISTCNRQPNPQGHQDTGGGRSSRPLSKRSYLMMPKRRCVFKIS